jgi:hypothetical protein
MMLEKSFDMITEENQHITGDLRYSLVNYLQQIKTFASELAAKISTHYSSNGAKNFATVKEHTIPNS